MSAGDVAVQYFSCVDAHDAERLSHLFAEDALLRPPPPIRQELRGRAAIQGFYAGLFTRAPDIRIDPDYQLVVDGNVCVARFSSWVGERHNQGVIDFFTVNDRDELVEMTAYRRLLQDGE
jgi:ketosteroid isomerase-like protein